jgi:5-methylcytosine-specific restriction enzyme B
MEDILRVAFLSRDAVEQILASLRRRKNLIIQGSPGVGKSFLSRRLAYVLVGAESPENVQLVQFHQSYAYEDFIQGWRPNGSGGFTLRNGVFHEFCRRAQSRPSEPHVFVIDEINRGNLSKVFGELLLLIEADKRGPDFAIPLTYAESASDTFYVPDNVFIIGLMNTADRSLAMVDYALRRRFAFVTLKPAFESPDFRRTLLERRVDPVIIDRIVERVSEVNERIASDHKNLGPGFAIGHSYFCPVNEVTDSQSWYADVVRDEIAPLLDEYWFDDSTTVTECLKILSD